MDILYAIGWVLAASGAIALAVLWYLTLKWKL